MKTLERVSDYTGSLGMFLGRFSGWLVVVMMVLAQ